MSTVKIIKIAFRHLVPADILCFKLGLGYYWRSLLKNNNIADHDGYIFSRPCLELKTLAHQELIHLLKATLEYARGQQVALTKISLRCPQIMDRLTWTNYAKSGSRNGYGFKALANWFESQETNHWLVIHALRKMGSQIKISFVKKGKLKRHLVIL